MIKEPRGYVHQNVSDDARKNTSTLSKQHASKSASNQEKQSIEHARKQKCNADFLAAALLFFGPHPIPLKWHDSSKRRCVKLISMCKQSKASKHGGIVG